jgi:biotin transport system permease protein
MAARKPLRCDAMHALYVAGDSPLHRLPAGFKLLACLLGSVVLALLHAPWQLVLALLSIACLYRLARIPLHAIASTLRPLLLIGSIVLTVQLALAGWREAAITALRLPAFVMFASLVTFTTPLSEMIETVTRIARPMARFGVSPVRIGLAIALAMRFIPALAKDWRDIEDARRARCARGASFLAIGPLILRILRMTNALGDAIAARDFDSRK